LSRRLFLGGAGALIGLPVLESLVGQAAHADDSFPMRLLAFYVPNGMHMPAWTPTSVGADYALSPILAPLANVKDKLLVLTGLSNFPSKPDGPGDHAAGTSGFLTCAHANKSESDVMLGISMDQVLAGSVGGDTSIASMQLGSEGGASTGGCDSGYSCAYTRNISWASATQPLAKTTNPKVVFDQIFQGADPNATLKQQQRRKLYRTSVLDYVGAEAKTLQNKLGHSDTLKLDQYLTGVFELEQRINKPAPLCEAIERPEDGITGGEHIRLMIDLMVLALQCDATRIVTYMLGNAGSNRNYGFIGASGNHHEISHHQNKQTNFDKLQIIDNWEITQFAYLLEKMAATTEGTGSLLDHSMVFFSSEIEDGNSHAHYNLPVLLAGGAHGKLATGQHLEFDPIQGKYGPPIADLYLTMMDLMGVELTSFGDNSTGKLSGITT
jgi:hypothetical protein